MSTTAEILGTVTSAASMVRNIVDTLKAVKDAAPGAAEDDVAKAQDMAIELKGTILSLQSDALSLQKEVSRLVEENSQLQRKISQYEERALEREKYERKKVGSDWVMVRQGETEPFYCPTCLEGERVAQLSQMPKAAWIAGSHRCPKCDSLFQLLS